MKKKILSLLLSTLLLLPVFSLRDKNAVTAESVTPSLEPTTFSAPVVVQDLETPLFVEDVTLYYGYEENIKPQVSSVYTTRVSYSYNEKFIQIKDGIVTAHFNQNMTVPVTASLKSGYSYTFNVHVKADTGLQSPGTILTSFNTMFEDFSSRPFETDKMTFFVGDSFFDTRYFYTDFYTRFAGENAACLGVGSTMSWQWYWVGQKLSRYQPENIVVHVGTNDLHAAGAVVDGVYNDIVNMFARWHENMPNTNMYWFTIEPRVNQDTNRVRIQELNGKVSAWAADKNWLTVIDSFTAFADNIDNGGKTFYKPDGLHLNCPAGYDKMMELADGAGLEISENALYNVEFAEQSFLTDKNTPLRQFIAKTEGTFVYETTIKINDCKDLFDHIAFDTVGSADDRFMLWNSKYDGKFRFEGYFDDTDYSWSARGTATHFAQKGDTVKVAILRTEKNVYFFVNDKLECVLVNAETGKELTIYTQSVSAEFTDCYFDTDGSFYQAYAQKAEIQEYENTVETEKAFYYDLAE